jgi:hypothetical protein
MSNENISLYYYSENGEVIGPFTVQELAGKITPDSMVVSENATKWVKASDVPEISDILFVQQPEEAEEFTPDELEVEDDSLLVVETEELETEISFDEVNYDTNTHSQFVSANENVEKSSSSKLPIIIIILLIIVGGSSFMYFKSDYYKWKSAVKMYCYIPTLKIRSDTTTFSESNVRRYARYGESFIVLNNPEISPWLDIKFDNSQGVVNSNFLMSENDFLILSPLLDTDVKQKQIENSKLRRSLVNHIISQSRLKSLSDKSWALNVIENYSYVKARKNYYNKTEYAIFYLQNGQYTEVVTFIYNDGKEIDKRSISEFSNYYNDITSYLRQYNMQY